MDQDDAILSDNDDLNGDDDELLDESILLGIDDDEEPSSSGVQDGELGSAQDPPELESLPNLPYGEADITGNESPDLPNPDTTKSDCNDVSSSVPLPDAAPLHHHHQSADDLELDYDEEEPEDHRATAAKRQISADGGDEVEPRHPPIKPPSPSGQGVAPESGDGSGRKDEPDSGIPDSLDDVVIKPEFNSQAPASQKPAPRKLFTVDLTNPAAPFYQPHIPPPGCPVMMHPGMPPPPYNMGVPPVMPPCMQSVPPLLQQPTSTAQDGDYHRRSRGRRESRSGSRSPVPRRNRRPRPYSKSPLRSNAEKDVELPSVEGVDEDYMKKLQQQEEKRKQLLREKEERRKKLMDAAMKPLSREAVAKESRASPPRRRIEPPKSEGLQARKRPAEDRSSRRRVVPPPAVKEATEEAAESRRIVMQPGQTRTVLKPTASEKAPATGARPKRTDTKKQQPAAAPVVATKASEKKEKAPVTPSVAAATIHHKGTVVSKRVLPDGSVEFVVVKPPKEQSEEPPKKPKVVNESTETDRTPPPPARVPPRHHRPAARRPQERQRRSLSPDQVRSRRRQPFSDNRPKRSSGGRSHRRSRSGSRGSTPPRRRARHRSFSSSSDESPRRRSTKEQLLRDFLPHPTSEYLRGNGLPVASAGSASSASSYVPHGTLHSGPGTSIVYQHALMPSGSAAPSGGPASSIAGAPPYNIISSLSGPPPTISVPPQSVMATSAPGSSATPPQPRMLFPHLHMPPPPGGLSMPPPGFALGVAPPVVSAPTTSDRQQGPTGQRPGQQQPPVMVRHPTTPPGGPGGQPDVQFVKVRPIRLLPPSHKPRYSPYAGKQQHALPPATRNVLPTVKKAQDSVQEATVSSTQALPRYDASQLEDTRGPILLQISNLSDNTRLAKVEQILKECNTVHGFTGLSLDQVTHKATAVFARVTDAEKVQVILDKRIVDLSKITVDLKLIIPKAGETPSATTTAPQETNRK